MKKIVVFFAMAALIVLASRSASAQNNSYQMSEVEFVNAIPAELVSEVTISIDEDVDTTFFDYEISNPNGYLTTDVGSITLKGVSASNNYTPTRDRWVVPDFVETIYVVFSYNGQNFSNSFDLDEGKTTIFLNPQTIGFMKPVKSEFSSDMVLIKNSTGKDIQIKVMEKNLSFPLDGVTLSTNGGTYTKLPSEAGPRHFLITSLQNGAVVSTTKTVFISNTTTLIEFTAEDVTPKTSETEVTSIKLANNTAYPITITLPAIAGNDTKPGSVQEPIEIYLAPGAKTTKWYKVNLGPITLTTTVSYKNQDIPYDVQTTVTERQKIITLIGGVKKGVRADNSPQSSSFHTY